MAYYLIKLILSALIIVIISEVSKRSSFLGAVLASLPLVSVLGMIWLYVDTKDVEKVSALATSIFWLVLPSLALFIALPLLLKQGVSFSVSMAVSIFVTIVCYGAMVGLLSVFGVKL